MIKKPITGRDKSEDVDLLRLAKAGHQMAKGMTLVAESESKQERAALSNRFRQVGETLSAAVRKADVSDPNGRWLADNYRLIRTAQRETRDLGRTFRHQPAVLTGNSEKLPRAYATGRAYLDAAMDSFTEEGLASFLSGFQEAQELEMGEIWALKPVLQAVLLERTANAASSSGSSLAVLVTSLRTISEAEWKAFFESVSIVDTVLALDPTATYAQMDYESRDQYRNAIAKLAKHSESSEKAVAQIAVDLAAGVSRASRGKTPMDVSLQREMHVGFWILDQGQQTLKQAIHHKASPLQRVRDILLSNADLYYIIGVEIVTLFIVVALLEGLDNLTPIVAGLLLLIVPATQAAVDFMNNLTSFLFRPRALPKLDFSEGIPADCATIVAVPTLLLKQTQVQQLIADLEIRYLANPDPNLYFALVTDSPDSDQQNDEGDSLVEVCVDLVEGLNKKYSTGQRTPFYLFHRHRVYNTSEGRWMGWERKRGKLLDLNQLMRGGYDSFPVKIGDLTVLPKIRYVITLDSDTQLPRDSAQKLVGAIAHPLNRAVLDPSTKMVVAGYGILQPRIGVSIQSSSASRLANLYSGQTGFDIYTRAISDVYQDLFGEGSFTGKGIYDIDALRETLEHRFPENALLSHDLIEGAYARAGLVSDIELIDDYPSHFSAYSRRKHRWVRGDWQIMRWLLPRVPDNAGKIVANPISVISRWKIIDNLRRSLFEPATLALLLGGWFWLPGDAWYWTLASFAMLLIPVWTSTLFSVLRAPLGTSLFKPWVKTVAIAFVRGNLMAFLHVVFLLHQALLSLDAIGRSVSRVFVTKKKMLEWETAAESESTHRRKSTVDIYLSWSPLVALAIAAALWYIRPAALVVAAPVLILWFFARWISDWLNRAPDLETPRLNKQDARFLRAAAVRTWRYFREWSTPEANWLIPDNVRLDGVAAQRLSPTNLGFLLNARIAAVHFGYLTVHEFAAETLQTLASFRKLRKYQGHILNWYDNTTLEALQPQFVSTVDSGNLVACLWTLKHAALSFAGEPPANETIVAGLLDIAEQASPTLHKDFHRRTPKLEDLLSQLEASTEALASREPQDTAYWMNELSIRVIETKRWLKEGVTAEVAAALQKIAQQSEELAAETDFRFLYNRRKKVLSIGMNVETERLEPASYDLLASESRIGSFVAISKGDVSQEAWFHLGRRHTLFAGQRVLVSWTGTMFEYLMPAIWMKQYRQTIMQDSMEAVIRVQQRVARDKKIPWGISESGCSSPITDSGQSGDYGYSAFGIPELAMKRCDGDSLVISPYSTFLALPFDPRSAVSNLRAMEKQGLFGRYGFVEAVDYRSGRPEVVQSWMAHHQGMSLLVVCNLLFGSPMQTYFHSEPRVLATELLLHERVPEIISIETEEPAGFVPQAAETPA